MIKISRGASILLLLFATITSGCVRVSSFKVTRTTQSTLFNSKLYEKMAVLFVDGSEDLSLGGEMQQVEDAFLQELIRKGYVPVARSDLNSVMAELRIQASVLTEKDAVRIGNVLNARAVLVVDVVTYKRALAMSARILDTERAQILWVSSYTASYNYFLRRAGTSTEIPEVARTVATELPARNR